MFAIREGMVNVFGQQVATFSRAVDVEKAPFTVEAGTNFCCGEDKDDGFACSYLSLLCDSSMVGFEPIKDKWGRCVGFEFFSFGDNVLDGLITSLEFALDALRDARAGVRD